VPENHLLAGFVAAALVILLIPGPAVLYLVTRSIAQGRRAGFVSVVGLSTGALVHVLAATAGLSAILVASATAFNVVKLLGAAYLIYLGIRALLAARRETIDSSAIEPPRSTSRIFTDGIIVSLFNPKIGVFFLAFLPQFVDPAAGPVWQQVLFLGLLYVGMALITDGLYVLLASGLRQWLGGVVRGPVPQYASGAIYIGLGLGTALSGRKQ
jgi:threonine/homoserine/homoserine lactone efflux protein